MDNNSRIMKELKELQEASRNVSLLAMGTLSTSVGFSASMIIKPESQGYKFK